MNLSTKELRNLPSSEQGIEIVWARTGGIIPEGSQEDLRIGVPKSGQVWFTPRMERNVQRLKRAVLEMQRLQELSSVQQQQIALRPMEIF